MGIFNFKSDNKLEETGKKIEELMILSGYSDVDTFKEFWNNTVKNQKIPFGSLEMCQSVMESIAKSKHTFNASINSSLQLYKRVVFNVNDKIQENLFIDMLEMMFSEIVSYNDLLKINGLFQDKSLLLNLISHIKNNYTEKEIMPLLNYMCRARQYYVNDNAFLATCFNIGEKIGKSVEPQYDDIIGSQIDIDKQLAGIYEISNDDIDKAVTEMELVKDTMKGIKEDIDSFQKKIGELAIKLSELSGLSDKKRDELLLEIKKCTNDFVEQKAEILNEISKEGNKSLNLISEQLSAHPEVKTQILSKEVSKQPIIIFDDQISLNKRLEMIKNKKKNGLYHYCFDDAIKQLLINKSLYLTGPGGSGKTKVVYQMAELLEIPIYNLGFIADEFTAFKGYLDANGNFVKTPFYTAFKSGGIVFLDEIDNSDSKALIELNKFVDNKGYKPYLFPNDELVYPHPNFRLVAAGNTWGDGADYAYSTREKLDASTIRRFAQIYCGFDNNLEHHMFDCGDKNMFEFAMSFRDALQTREGEDDFSTGDLQDVNIYLSSGIYTIDEIFELKFIRNRRVETLQNIVSHISKQIPNNHYANLFKEKVNEKSRLDVKTKNKTRR